MASLDFEILIINGVSEPNPVAWLVKTSEPINNELFIKISNTQLGAKQTGGHLIHILSELKALGINSKVIYTGRYRDFLLSEDEGTLTIYKLITPK